MPLKTWTSASPPLRQPSWPYSCWAPVLSPCGPCAKERLNEQLSSCFLSDTLPPDPCVSHHHLFRDDVSVDLQRICLPGDPGRVLPRHLAAYSGGLQPAKLHRHL